MDNLNDNSQLDTENTQEQSQSGTGDKKELTVEELQSEIKSLRKEAASYRVKAKEHETNSLTLTEQLKLKNDELNTITAAVKSEKILSKFNEVAEEYGVIDSKVAFKLTQIENITLDENNVVNVDSVKTTLDALKEEYPAIFKTPTPTDKTKIDAANNGDNSAWSFNKMLNRPV